MINVSGHRMGTAEVEAALVSHPKVSEAAVVGFPHNLKGQGIYCYVTLIGGASSSDALKIELRDWVRKEIGPIASPISSSLPPACPKSGRARSCAASSARSPRMIFSNLGDISTLAHPAVVDDLIQNRQNKSSS